MTKILFRALIEILGKPQEHVEASLQGYVQKIKEDDRYNVVSEELAVTEKREKEELWATFAELEIKTDRIDHIIDFCFDFMPSIIEILEPNELILADTQLSTFFNDLQAKLHQVDMIAKQVKLEHDLSKKNLTFLLQNYIQVLLNKSDRLSAQQLSGLTGVSQEELEDFLDKLIDKNIIDLKEGYYFLKEKEQ